jgi:hypothetical protein
MVAYEQLAQTLFCQQCANSREAKRFPRLAFVKWLNEWPLLIPTVSRAALCQAFLACVRCAEHTELIFKMRTVQKIFCILLLFIFLTGRYLNFGSDYSQAFGKSRRVLNLDDLQQRTDQIFFVETIENKTDVTGRVLCAMESAARYNPDKQIYLVISLHSRIHSLQSIFENVLPNMHLVRIDIFELTYGTAVQDLWNSKMIQKSKYGYSHISDMLRFLLLYKFGGYYFDSGERLIGNSKTIFITLTSFQTSFRSSKFLIS